MTSTLHQIPFKYLVHEYISIFLLDPNGDGEAQESFRCYLSRGFMAVQHPLQICSHRRWWTRMQRSAAHRSQIHWFSVCAVCFLGHGSGPFSIHKRANGFAETDSRPTNKPLLRHFLSICQITQRHWRHLFHGRTLHWDWELYNVRTQSHCLKITEKVSFNIASEASYANILCGQKFIKIAKNLEQKRGPF